MLLQILLFAFSASAIWLLSMDSRRAERWGFLVGLLGQPFWLVETWSTGQMGMFVLSAFYTLAWLKGVHRCWFRRVSP